jgi:NDP-sugar pyrophosphorylase family protein
MDVIILAAGKGNRLKPLTDKTPKSLIKLGKKTILENILDSLPEKKIKNVFIVVGHLSEKIETFLAKTKKNYLFEINTIKQKKLNGTYAAIRLAKNRLSDWFVVLGGDDLHGKKDLEKFFTKKMILGVSYKDSRYFKVDFDKKNRFLGFERQGQKSKRYIATGSYTLHKSFFDLKPEKTIENEYGIPQTIEKNIKELKPIVIKEHSFHQLNTFEDLELLKAKYKAL